jgi:hypothetical protein
LSKREEILDMAVHALSPLMRGRKDASPYDLFDESLEIAEKLVAKVEETAKIDGAPPRDELIDMGVHALSALLNGRQPPRVDEVLGECMEVAQSLISKVDETLGDNADDSAREELLDMAVHVQTAFLSTRPRMPADELSDQCVAVALKLIARVDGTDL